MVRKISFVVLTLLIFSPAAARAQGDGAPNVDTHKAEVGVLYTGVNLDGFGETVNGLGGRFGYNFNRNLALDTEFSFFPETHLGNRQFGQKTQAFAGIKAGARSRYVGLFAKARPGVMFIGEVTSGFNCNGTSFGRTCRPSHNNLRARDRGAGGTHPSAGP